MFRNRTEQETVDGKWKELVKLTTAIAAAAAAEKVVGRTSAKGKNDRDTWWWTGKVQSRIRKMPLRPAWSNNGNTQRNIIYKECTRRTVKE